MEIINGERRSGRTTALLSEKLDAKIAAITICVPVAMKERYREEPDKMEGDEEHGS